MTRTLTDHYLRDARVILLRHRPDAEGLCERCHLNGLIRCWPCAAATFANRALEILPSDSEHPHTRTGDQQSTRSGRRGGAADR